MDTLINIDVPDLERAIRFYQEGIGLRLKRKLFEDSTAEMTGSSMPIYLITKAEASRPDMEPGSGRTYKRHWTPVHLDFVVSDLASAIIRAEAAGAKLESGPEIFAWGSLATFSDPFGHGLCLMQWSDGGYAKVE
ncbi:MAG TPA: VOC family protein [Gammaproteobacteria bacterium]